MSSPMHTTNSTPLAAEDHVQLDGREARASPRTSQSLIVTAIGRYKLLVLVFAVVFTGAGIAAGIKRKPVWTAAATVQVGKINPNSPGFSGFVQSSTDLATTLSRAITADGVLAIVHSKTGLTPVQSAQRLTATPVPDGAAFSVIATGSTAHGAIDLANIGANAMISYEAANNPVGSAATVYRAYQTQARVLERARANVRRVQNRRAIRPSTANLNSTGPALVEAEAAADDAQTRANGLAAAYTQALESSPSGSLLSPLASALTASGDGKHKIELYGFLGLAAGLLLGGAIAIVLEQRRTRPTPAH
jgi:uncharacterized protein involved in exopolysaccharide biosynthesis